MQPTLLNFRHESTRWVISSRLHNTLPPFHRLNPCDRTHAIISRDLDHTPKRRCCHMPGSTSFKEKATTGSPLLFTTPSSRPSPSHDPGLHGPTASIAPPLDASRQIDLLRHRSVCQNALNWPCPAPVKDLGRIIRCLGRSAYDFIPYRACYYYYANTPGTNFGSKSKRTKGSSS